MEGNSSSCNCFLSLILTSSVPYLRWTMDCKSCIRCDRHPQHDYLRVSRSNLFSRQNRGLMRYTPLVAATNGFRNAGFKNDGGFCATGAKLQDLERRINSSFQVRTYFKPDFGAFGRKDGVRIKTPGEHFSRHISFFIFFFRRKILFQRCTIKLCKLRGTIFYLFQVLEFRIIVSILTRSNM